MAYLDSVSGVSCVGFGPPSRGVPREVFGLFRTVPTRRAPRRNVVGEVAGVSAVVERELFDSVITDAEVRDFLGEVPLSATALAGYRRSIGSVVGRI